MLRYAAPTLIRLGRIEELTGQLRRGVPDLLGHGNIL
ncbi:lasso RiPP family leader peptide-containing protein [Streptomyces sp. AC550_RSS872]|nr:lasso RiPP family leader peptide-containing protein [Streptomyces sp. AC550_RSS872]